MEIKFTIKDGEKSSSFKFAGEPLDVIDGLASRVSKLWEQVFPDGMDKEWEAFVKRNDPASS